MEGTRHCDWEDGDFAEGQFRRYRGQIYLHFTESPEHLTNGQLPDQNADLTGGAAASVDFAAGDAGPVDDRG